MTESSVEPRPDRRRQRSREALLDALMSLMMERGYERLTIQNLLDRANVGRATFYAHFGSKEELLAQSVDRLRGYLEEASDRSRPSAAEEGVRLGFSMAFFEHLHSHRSIYDTTIRRESEHTVKTHIERLLAELVHRDLRRVLPRLPEVTADLVVRYTVGTFWALVVWWIDRHPKLTPQKIDGLFRRLVFPGIEVILGEASVD